MKPGDVIEVEIEGIGVLRNLVGARDDQVSGGLGWPRRQNCCVSFARSAA